MLDPTTQALLPGDDELAAFLANVENARLFEELATMLQTQGVGEVTPPSSLLRQGTDWKRLRQPPLVLAPRDLWSNIVPTLRLVRDHLVPPLGSLEVVSAYRTALYNGQAGGARASKHLGFHAVDLIPHRPIARDELVQHVKGVWLRVGKSTNMGLGFYGGIRFHVDTFAFRTW